ncbi:MAG: hypothetical protein VKL42_08895 [Snowella sp.]|nr:hypothetical protein [Snowella sp.]
MPKRKQKRNQKTCRCDAYPFPHRLYGGKCHGLEDDDDDDGSDILYEEWLDRNNYFID